MSDTAQLTLRRAVFDDWALLLDWVNRPDSLAVKLKTDGPIEADAHKAWLRRFLDRGEGAIYIVETDAGPAGQVRLQPNATGEFVIDVYIAPSSRGGGMAKQALSLGMMRVVEEQGARDFLAQVVADNDASHRLFRSLGFVADGGSDGVTDYRLAARQVDVVARVL